MGFSHIPPRLTIPDVIATLDKWEPRGDAAIVLITPQWRSMLADTSAAFHIRREYFEIVNRYRGKGFTIIVMIDPSDGLNRSRESPELIALGRKKRRAERVRRRMPLRRRARTACRSPPGRTGCSRSDRTTARRSS